MSEEDFYKQNEISDFKLELSKFMVAEQVLSGNGRMFFKDLIFDSYGDFEKIYKKNLDPHFYEIIQGKQSLYFDFDCSEKISDLDFSIFNQKILEEITEKFPIIINLYTSHSTTGKKFSYHVIVKGIFFDDHEKCGFVAKKIVANLNDENLLKKYFDNSVYTSRRNFRMLGSRKIGSDRIKIFSKNLYKSENYKNRFESNDLRMSLVGEIYDSEIFIVNLKKNDEPFFSEKNNFPEINWDQKKIDFVKIFLAAKFSGQFNIGKNKKNFLSLERKSTGMCLVCNRVHSSDNAYVSFFGEKFYFVCWRNPENKFLIEDETEKIKFKIVDDDDEKFIDDKKPIKKNPVTYDKKQKFLEIDEFLYGF